MKNKELYAVALFESVSHAMRAEKLLEKAGIPCKLIPVPRHISSDCGVCLRFASASRLETEKILAGKVWSEIREIR